MPRVARVILLRLLGAKTLGRLDYILKRRPKDAFGDPVDGQRFRHAHVQNGEVYPHAAITAVASSGTT
jgi:hypothetical protein